MKIREIRVAGLRGATPAGGWSTEISEEQCVHTLLAVVTDEGLLGLGSVATSDDLVRGALQVLAPLYLGESAIEPDRLSETLHQHTFWQGRGGAITHTISGLDLACWDLLGQVTGQPVGRLLGGCYRERVLPYASLLMAEPAVVADRITAATGQGFRAIKLGWGPFGRHSPALDEALVRAARVAAGDAVRLMVDAGGSDAFWGGDYHWAVRTAAMLAHYDVAWFEEPLAPDALADYVALRRQAPLPIAGGEVLTRRQSVLPWLAAGAVDIVQPDLTKVGGISEAQRIAWQASDHGVRVIPHGWNTAVGLAADLQFVAALAPPSGDHVEYLLGSPNIDELATTGWALDGDGMLPIPSTPGLGITLDPAAVARYTGEPRFLTV